MINFVAVDDIGRVINPMIVEGQVQGGVAQGIGQALLENAVYDTAGQLLSGSMMDYTMPRADNLPNITVGTEITMCTHNPLGVKGCGEVGAIGSPPAMINAVVDALKRLRRAPIDMPATPQKIWWIIQPPPPQGGGIDRDSSDVRFRLSEATSVADAVKAARRRCRGQGDGRRHDVHPGAEAAAEQAQRAGRSGQARADGHQGSGNTSPSAR